jgi:hypothetical protein
VPISLKYGKLILLEPSLRLDRLLLNISIFIAHFSVNTHVVGFGEKLINYA